MSLSPPFAVVTCDVQPASLNCSEVGCGLGVSINSTTFHCPKFPSWRVGQTVTLAYGYATLSNSYLPVWRKQKGDKGSGQSLQRGGSQGNHREQSRGDSGLKITPSLDFWNRFPLQSLLHFQNQLESRSLGLAAESHLTDVLPTVTRVDSVTFPLSVAV